MWGLSIPINPSLLGVISVHKLRYQRSRSIVFSILVLRDGTSRIWVILLHVTSPVPSFVQYLFKQSFPLPNLLLLPHNHTNILLPDLNPRLRTSFPPQRAFQEIKLLSTFSINPIPTITNNVHPHHPPSHHGLPLPHIHPPSHNHLLPFYHLNLNHINLHRPPLVHNRLQHLHRPPWPPRTRHTRHLRLQPHHIPCLRPQHRAPNILFPRFGSWEGRLRGGKTSVV